MRQNARHRRPIRHETNIAGAAADIWSARSDRNACKSDQCSSLPCDFAAGPAGPGVRRGGRRRRGRNAPPVAIQFSLDRPINSSAAPFVLAASRGLFGAEGLSVNINIASGSLDGIARVAAGTSDFALVDINQLIRFRDTSGAPPIKAVFVLLDKAPYAIVARRSRGIQALPTFTARRSASPRATCRSGFGRRWRGRTKSRPPASSRAGSAPPCASRCCRRARSTP